jgi:membrane fusion protein (multidrug efflux system)
VGVDEWLTAEHVGDKLANVPTGAGTQVSEPNMTDRDATLPADDLLRASSKNATSRMGSLAILLAALAACIGVVLFLPRPHNLQPHNLLDQGAVADSPENSTFDAFVAGHVTSVSSRVVGHVRQVLVAENQRVNAGDTLIELDKEPFEVQVAIKQAAVTAAEADLAVAQAQVRALAAQVRANRYKLDQAIEDVNSQIASLKANVSALDSKKATLELARGNLKRGEELAPSGVISREEVAKRQQAVDVAAAAVDGALHEVNSSRASLGLPPRPAQSADLGEVPADHDQTDSSVRQALLEMLQSVALLGYAPATWKATPRQVIDSFYAQDPDKDIDRIFAQMIARAPAMRQSEAKLLQARRDLEQTELVLRDCRLESAIPGVVVKRSVSPGNNVHEGDELLILSSLTEVWITASVDLTAGKHLRREQKVRCEVETPGGQREIEGHIAGFSGGAMAIARHPRGGSTKRAGDFSQLMVRIDLDNYEPGDDPIFVGLPVVVHVAGQDHSR